MDKMSGDMLRRKSLSLEKSPHERGAGGRRERQRRSSVAAGALTAVDARERRGSIVQRWFRHISEAADAYKNRNGRTTRPDAGLSGTHAPPETEPPSASASASASANDTESVDSHDDSIKADELDTSGASQESCDSGQSQQSSPTPATLTPEHQPDRKSVTSSPSQRRPMDPLRLTTVENPLIQPSEIIVSQKAVLKAEPVLTPLEQIRVQDVAIRRALQEKQQLVADLLHVPREEFLTIAEMAGEPGSDKEAAELVLAAICQANQLTEVLNESLRVTEEDAVAAESCSPRNRRRATRTPHVPALPSTRVHNIATALNAHLTHLLELVKERDEEREKLRRELQKSRNQVNALHEAHRKGASSCPACSTRASPALQNDTGPPPDSEAGANEVDNDAVDGSSSSAANVVSPDNLNTNTENEEFVENMSGESLDESEAVGGLVPSLPCLPTDLDGGGAAAAAGASPPAESQHNPA